MSWEKNRPFAGERAWWWVFLKGQPRPTIFRSAVNRRLRSRSLPAPHAIGGCSRLPPLARCPCIWRVWRPRRPCKRRRVRAFAVRARMVVCGTVEGVWKVSGTRFVHESVTRTLARLASVAPLIAFRSRLECGCALGCLSLAVKSDGASAYACWQSMRLGLSCDTERNIAVSQLKKKKGCCILHTSAN